MLNQEFVSQAIQNAIDGKSNLTPELLAIRGFSTPTIRHLFNNLCNIDGVYLEIGLFCGASFCSSFNKDLVAVGVENHFQDFSAGFDIVKQELFENVRRFSDRSKDVKVIYEDCFNIDKSLIPKVDIYSFDGFHSFQTQAQALPYFLDCMKDRFLFLVDDINWDYVREGTKKGFEDLKDKIEIETTWILGEGQHNHPVFHNGVSVSIINKK